LPRLAGDGDADDLNEPLLGRERSAPHRDTSCSAAGTSSAGTQQGGGNGERGKGASVALVLRSVNRIDWAELWSVLCSSVWGAYHTLPVKALLVLQAASGRHAGNAALEPFQCSTPFHDRGCTRAATLAGCLAPFLPASLRPFRLNALEARRSVAHCCGQYRARLSLQSVAHQPVSASAAVSSAPDCLGGQSRTTLSLQVLRSVARQTVSASAIQ